MFLRLAPLWLIGVIPGSVLAQETTSPRPPTTDTFAGLTLRNIGPAVRSGRIADIAKDPTDPSIWYVAVASGNVWKTVNAGTTWTPIFERYGSYSMGAIALDPNDPNTIWLGTGENASQRSAGFGDGVYKSVDGGMSWTNVGLPQSEHIGKILVDPRDSDVVFVAAQGPLWAPGGDRGLYRTRDGGRSWEPVLQISEHTGVTDIAFEPGNPDIVYAASYQRRRHVGILVAGGPESAIYKSMDGGESWRRITEGLPGVDLGRIAIAVSPMHPEVVYALVAAAEDQSGFFRSTDRGERWARQSDYIVVDPQYYGEIYPDPHQFDRVYAVDVRLHVTHDGGRTFEPIARSSLHVDHHALVFDRHDPDYLMVGNDGGIYESWDRGETWKHVRNLPITQFYRVGLDNSRPFYYVYGGTQDNATLGGPSRTANIHGIRNRDWFVTVGGDGFQPRIDPDDPNIVYAMFQYAGIVRFDRRSGERLDIQPQPEPGAPPLRWHWDAPLIISPHQSRRLYFAANRLFRSDDRGDTWLPGSPDLSRGLDRNQIEVMGRIWSVDAVWKNVFTSPYGTVVALDESPLVEGLLYAGTDDGLIQVSEDGGQSWRRVERFPGVPARTYVADLAASKHDPDVVFAALNNHKNGDFAPYLLRSTDRGRTWTSMVGDLPDRQPVWSVVQDHVESELLFLGTEFGLFFTRNGGANWIALRGGVPTVAFRDLEIQTRENDLVGASFGRGFFIFDDYTPLRLADPITLAREAVLFPVRDALAYIERQPLGGSRRGSGGDALYSAPNPPFGAVFTYHLRDDLVGRRTARRREEQRRRETGERIGYPTWEELRAEDREAAPEVVLTVEDDRGNVVRRVTGPNGAGFHRVAWDLRYPSVRPVTDESAAGGGPLVAPGEYTVRLARRVDGVMSEVGDPRSFRVVPLLQAGPFAADSGVVAAFHERLRALQRVVLGVDAVVDATLVELDLLVAVLDATAAETSDLADRARRVRNELLDAQVRLRGDATVTSRAELAVPGIVDRVQRVVRARLGSTAAVTTTHARAYEIAADALAALLLDVRPILESELPDLHAQLDDAGVPWTPGRPLPRWPPR